jgi:hypothetical protein
MHSLKIYANLFHLRILLSFSEENNNNVFLVPCNILAMLHHFFIS